ncbi:SDR family oxidoreductase, partial [Hallerella succinigenes]|uniref:SDR family oxidoreductase n=1 Tax=Hallerella succinigenes TaxID=1896222 RepID=UPI002A7F270A
MTGGAHGIGATIVNEFEKEGAQIAYIDIRENPCFVGDLSQKEVLEKFADFVIQKFGHVDVLVNNALPLMKG